MNSFTLSKMTFSKRVHCLLFGHDFGAWRAVDLSVCPMYELLVCTRCRVTCGFISTEAMAEDIPPKGKGLTDRMRKLKAGESFVLSGAVHASRVMPIAKRLGIQVTTRKVAGGLEVWRVDEKVK
jgi:hypothetical protein